MKRKFHLIVDVGNTTTNIGIFEKDKFLAKCLFNTFEDDKKVFKTTFENLVKPFAEFNYDFEDALIFSVVPLFNDSIKKIIKKYFKTKASFFDWEKYDLKMKDPKITDKIGADLIADLIAAEMIYGHPALVVDLGTVNKFLLIDKSGKFVGASFTPGITSQIKLFSKETALLPKMKNIEEEVNEEFGINTKDSMKHGVYWSVISSIEYQHKVQAELMKHPVYLIVTGGNSEFIKDKVEDKIYDPLLTLKGMNILYLESKNEL